MRALVLVVVVVALVAGVAGSYRYGLLDRFLDDGSAAPLDPATVPPPAGLDVPAVTAPDPVADPASGPRARRAAVARALAPFLGKRSLGPHVLAAVAPLGDGADVFTRGTGGATPASTTKVVTTTAALLALGPDHTFETTVRTAPGPGGSGRTRQIVLVGGGDPLLARVPTEPGTYPVRADVADLAAQTADSLRADGVRRVTLGYDTSLFTGPAVNPRWEPGYLPSEVAATSALWVDEGRSALGVRQLDDPALEAARSFATALTAAGVRVRGEPQQVDGGQDDGPPAGDVLASVSSPPLAQIVERILLVSDNDGAEVLLRQVGLAENGVGSIESGRRGVRAVLDAAGVDLGSSVLHDGSGLSRDNVLAPQVLADVLRLAASADHPDLRSVVTGLPVAGFSGSLADRMDQGDPAGLGRVRAKTGTLTGVFTLAGIAVDLDGTPLVFVLMADRVRLPRAGEAQATLDNAAAALGACRCS